MKLDFFLTSMITENCNLKCKYCYLNKKSKREMTLNTAKKLIKGFLDYNNEKAYFNWIGGEPLIKPDSFFDKISEYAQGSNKKNLSISHSIQSNGLSLTQERFNSLYKICWNIGVSYDGTPEIQKSQRDLSEAMQERILNNMKNTKRKVGVISVLTKNAVGKEKEIYDSLKNYTNRAKINFYSPLGRGLEYEKEFLPSEKEAQNILLNFYELWKNDNSDLTLSPYKEMVRSFFTGFSTICGYSAISCYQNLGADIDGNIYLCPRATHMPEMKLGNIKDGLNNIIGNEKHNLILKRYLKLKEETKDSWHSYSSGGCPLEAYFYKGDFMEEGYYNNKVRNPLFNKIKMDLKNGKIRSGLERKAGFE